MRLVALQYHDVVGDEGFDASGFVGAAAATYKMRVERFADHLEAIARASRGAPLTAGALSVHESLRNRRVLLTFDDGGASAHTRIANMLESRGWRGHFFVTTDYIGRSTFLDEAQIRELHERGHVIGAHSRSHPLRMARCSWDELHDEWTSSLERLTSIVGVPVTVASVPGGYYHRRVAEAASAAGVRTLFTSEPVTRCQRVEACLVIGRFTLRRGSAARTAGALARGARWPRWNQWLSWNVKKAVKRTAGGTYLRTREALLK